MYETLYVVFTLVFLAGAVSYWLVTRVFTSNEGIYLSETKAQKDD